VTFYDYSVAAATAVGAPVMADAKANAESLIAAAVATASRIAPDIEVRGQAVRGHAAHMLVKASADGATIVVGNRGRGDFASLLLGSVSQHVALHAHGPVVVVRGRSDPHSGPIVVGVDGSLESQHALQLAFEEAAMRGTDVAAVRAYGLLGPSYSPDVPGFIEDSEQRQDAEMTALAADVASWARKYPDVHISCSAIAGSPAQVLSDQSSKARLVVVGTRGHGGFTGLLLGSVGLHLLHHANCPVLVARAVNA
jgi:nucleotide-binding universal stress UspA family protein